MNLAKTKYPKSMKLIMHHTTNNSDEHKSDDYYITILYFVPNFSTSSWDRFYLNSNLNLACISQNPAS